jgi:hypothetical protein
LKRNYRQLIQQIHHYQDKWLDAEICNSVTTERLPSERTLFNPNEKDQIMNNVRKYLR